MSPLRPASLTPDSRVPSRALVPDPPSDRVLRSRVPPASFSQDVSPAVPTTRPKRKPVAQRWYYEPIVSTLSAVPISGDRSDLVSPFITPKRVRFSLVSSPVASSPAPDLASSTALPPTLFPSVPRFPLGEYVHYFYPTGEGPDGGLHAGFVSQVCLPGVDSNPASSLEVLYHLVRPHSCHADTTSLLLPDSCLQKVPPGILAPRPA